MGRSAEDLQDYGDIVGSDAGSGFGTTQGAQFTKGAASKNSNREAGCNELAAGRQAEMASDADAGSVIVSKSSGRPDNSQNADNAFVPVRCQYADEELCVYHGSATKPFRGDRR
uniref:Uncharacterized protein n=1 Tax=Glossina morsitans morsitans TaxID=37546 RepID=A0A1B0GEL7_GLOMM